MATRLLSQARTILYPVPMPRWHLTRRLFSCAGDTPASAVPVPLGSLARRLLSSGVSGAPAVASLPRGNLARLISSGAGGLSAAESLPTPLPQLPAPPTWYHVVGLTGFVLVGVQWLMTDLLSLRLVAMCSSLLFIVYNLKAVRPPLLLPIAANFVFILINAAQVVILLLACTELDLQTHERLLWDHLFSQAGLSQRQMRALLEVGSLECVRAGEALPHGRSGTGAEGGPLTLSLVVDGIAAVYVGSNKQVATLGRGEFCGEMSFLDESRLPVAQVVATETVSFVRWDASELRAFFANHPEVRHAVQAIWNQQLIRKLDQMDERARLRSHLSLEMPDDARLLSAGVRARLQATSRQVCSGQDSVSAQASQAGSARPAHRRSIADSQPFPPQALAAPTAPTSSGEAQLLFARGSLLNQGSKGGSLLSAPGSLSDSAQTPVASATGATAAAAVAGLGLPPAFSADLRCAQADTQLPWYMRACLWYHRLGSARQELSETDAGA
mmetsp:Transcript_24970/g.57745  ORF Transcript_24970/g.57745 Transcript_24970/m.57745 type:complete len:500 (+) Transcript_24970:49-1548(+)